MGVGFGADFTGWFLVGNQGMSALHNPLKGIYGTLIPSFPTKNQPVSGGDFAGFGPPGFSWFPNWLQKGFRILAPFSEILASWPFADHGDGSF